MFSVKLEFASGSDFRDNSSFGLNILGPLCLWHCLTNASGATWRPIFLTNASGATWLPNFQEMKAVPPAGQDFQLMQE